MMKMTNLPNDRNMENVKNSDFLTGCGNGVV